jgi:hypothetical protein
MRWLTLLLIACLVLAVSGPARGFAFLEPYNGPIKLKFQNWDVGTLYNVADGVYTGEAALNGLTQTPPPSRFGIEDTWGVVQLTDIIGVNGNVPLWSYLTAPTEVTGLFWGERDTSLIQTTDGSGNVTQQIEGVGLHIAFWEDPNKDLGDPRLLYAGTGNTGTARRTGATTFDGATEGTLLWTLDSVAGFGTGGNEFFATFSPSGNIIFPGYNSVGGALADFVTNPAGTGTQNPPNGFFLDNPGADWRVTWTGVHDPMNVFEVLSDDPILATTVPEPATMVLVALGGLGVLFGRKRK